MAPVEISSNRENVNQLPRMARDDHIRKLSTTGHVGFDALPDQLVSKCIQNGFSFNVMCIGETGLGKSTLIDSLFNTHFESTPQTHTLPNVSLNSRTYELQESNVKLKLTICDTIGYGDQINKSDSCSEIVQYIDTQFEAYLQEELKIKRALGSYHDSRIHACLYFISPTGHSLKSLDIICMKKLQSKVNIIPIIAKSDVLCKSDLIKFKQNILGALKQNAVDIYQFPVDDLEVCATNKSMNALLPFAVVGSTEFVKVGSKMVRAREYPWGVVQVENENHCEFVKLREMLIRTNMEDLRLTTHSKHYEMFRRRRLQEMGFGDVGPDNRPASIEATYESRRSELLKDIHAKENHMRQLFVLKVKEKEAELKESEKQLQERFERMKQEESSERKQLEEDKRALEEEILEFTRVRNSYSSSTIRQNKRK